MFFLDFFSSREKKIQRSGGTREKKRVEKEKKSTLFLRKSVKNYTLIYFFSYKVIIGKKNSGIYICIFFWTIFSSRRKKDSRGVGGTREQKWKKKRKKYTFLKEICEKL